MSTNTFTSPLHAQSLSREEAHTVQLRHSGLLSALQLQSEVQLMRGLEAWVDQQLDSSEDADSLKDYSYALQNSYVELSSEDLGEKGRALQEMIRQICPTLELRVHLIPKAAYQAFTLTNPLDHRALFGISTSMLRDFTARELAFVFGHELGHQIFGHTQEHARLQQSLSALPEGDHPIRHLMQSLKRRAEISCDRAGLICCGDLDVALRALCKVATDAPMREPEISESIYRALTDHTNTYHFIDAEIDQAAPWLEGHPTLAIRVKALRAFGEQELHLSLPDHLSAAQRDALDRVDQQTDSLLDQMEHDYLKRDKRLVMRFQKSILRLSRLLQTPAQRWGQRENRLWRESIHMLRQHASFGRRARLTKAMSFMISPDSPDQRRRLETLKRELS